jgi:predicted metal-binding membrane protein
MLVMFGSGGKSMLWIAALTGILIAEKGLPRYQHIRYAIGIGLLLLAIGMVLYYRSF